MMPRINIRLKTAILKSGLSQFEVARRAGISAGSLSQIVHYWFNPTLEMRERIASVLGVEVKDIFSSRQYGTPKPGPVSAGPVDHAG
jgi:transcriptional regulator with XRE-family HTH domain